jgi:CubicO group peptidase (beta-lactamase class C family)
MPTIHQAMARTATLLSLALLLAPPAHAEDAFTAFDAKLEALRREHKLPGLAVAVVRDGKLAWSKGYGFADQEKEVAVTPDTPFWIASVTKTFLGLLFLQLEADGKISLDDKINDVPKFDSLCEWLAGSTIPFGKDLRCNAPITIRNILNHTVNGTPGTRFLYNPIMYSRLSRYIEHKNGRSVDLVEGRQNTMAQLVETRILAPAGMSRTMSSQWQREKALVYFDMAQGFGVDKEGYLIKRPHPERELAGGAGIVSTVLDLAKYDIAIDSGKLASKAVMEKLFTPAKAPDGTTLPYAFGWYVEEYRGEKLYWHSGWDEEAGFSALYLKVPAKRLALILLANGEGLWWDNPLDKAEVEKSPFAQAFFDRFVFTSE